MGFNSAFKRITMNESSQGQSHHNAIGVTSCYVIKVEGLVHGALNRVTATAHLRRLAF